MESKETKEADKPTSKKVEKPALKEPSVAKEPVKAIKPDPNVEELFKSNLELVKEVQSLKEELSRRGSSTADDSSALKKEVRELKISLTLKDRGYTEKEQEVIKKYIPESGDYSNILDDLMVDIPPKTLVEPKGAGEVHTEKEAKDLSTEGSNWIKAFKKNKRKEENI